RQQLQQEVQQLEGRIERLDSVQSRAKLLRLVDIVNVQVHDYHNEIKSPQLQLQQQQGQLPLGVPLGYRLSSSSCSSSSEPRESVQCSSPPPMN
ncbi:unnamed protein product, partial [Lampetra planeri]